MATRNDVGMTDTRANVTRKSCVNEGVTAAAACYINPKIEHCTYSKKKNIVNYTRTSIACLLINDWYLLFCHVIYRLCVFDEKF